MFDGLGMDDDDDDVEAEECIASGRIPQVVG